MRRTLLLLAFSLAAAGCKAKLPYRVCEACIMKEGQMFCGQSYTNLKKDPDLPVDKSKLAAGQAACNEFAARKGGGYAGPPFEAAKATCMKAVKPADLMRVKCEDQIFEKVWQPKDGGDAL